MAQEQRIPLAERAVLGLAAVALALGIGAYYYFAAQPQVLRVLMVLAGAATGVAIAMCTATGKRGWTFAGEARQEIRRMVWPTRKEAAQVTLAVAVAVVLVGVLLWMFDWVVSRAVGFLIGLES